MCPYSNGLRHSLHVCICPDYFMAAAGEACSAACAAKQRTCDVDALKTAAGSVEMCEEIIEDLGMNPTFTSESADDDSGCLWDSSRGGGVVVMKTNGSDPTCDAVTNNTNATRVCACTGLSSTGLSIPLCVCLAEASASVLWFTVLLCVPASVLVLVHMLRTTVGS